MIDLGLSEDFLKGFYARCKDIPFDSTQSDEWKDGWKDANWQKKVDKMVNEQTKTPEDRLFITVPGKKIVKDNCL